VWIYKNAALICGPCTESRFSDIEVFIIVGYISVGYIDFGFTTVSCLSVHTSIRLCINDVTAVSCRPLWRVAAALVHLGTLLSIFYTVSKKTVQNCFCQNFVKFKQILIIFDRKIAKSPKLCEMQLFSTSPNSRNHTTVLNADVQNCYTTLKVVICSKLSNDFNSTSKVNVVYLAEL